MRKIALLFAALLVSACASSLRDDYDRGAVTPFARAVITESRAPETAGPAETAAEDEALAKMDERLKELEAEWREKARSELFRPEEFGLPAADVTADDLKSDLTLAKVAGAAYSMSPAVAAARQALRATVEQYDQVAYLDTLLRQYRGFTKDLDLRVGAPRQRESTDAFFPFPGTMALKTEIVSQDARAAAERLGKTTRDTLVSAGKSYYQYAYLGEAIGIVTENVGLLRDMVDIAESKYGVGKAGQSVVLRLRVEIDSLEDRLVTLRENHATERSKLASILGLPADFPLGKPADPTAEKPPVAPDPLYPVARKDRQELKALRAKIASTEALIELAETKTYPAQPLGSRPSGMPKFWFGQTASFIEEMKARLEGMKKDLADRELHTEYLVKDSWFRWDAAFRQVELHEKSLLPQAEQSWRVLQSGWQEGVADFLDALDAERTWLRYRLEYRQAVKDTNTGRLSLVDALGTDIPAEAAAGGEGGGK